MPRRLFQVRPKELTTTLEKWEFEVFVIDKEPLPKRAVKYQFDNETVISVKVCFLIFLFCLISMSYSSPAWVCILCKTSILYSLLRHCGCHWSFLLFCDTCMARSYWKWCTKGQTGHALQMHFNLCGLEVCKSWN